VPYALPAVCLHISSVRFMQQWKLYNNQVISHADVCAAIVRLNFGVESSKEVGWLILRDTISGRSPFPHTIVMAIVCRFFL